MPLESRLKRRLLTSLAFGFGLDVGFVVMGLMNIYPVEWDELLPGTMLGRRIFEGFHSPEGLLGAFVIDGLAFAVIPFMILQAFEHFTTRTD